MDRARRASRAMGQLRGTRSRLMRILLATDAWEPQVNGVVRTLTRVVAELREMGEIVEVISPDQFTTFPLPTYPEIKLAIGAYEKVQERFKAFEPEAIHIATEGPIGLAARRICLEWKLPFTTSYHTRFPEYVSARLPVPLAAGYAYMRWFHRPSGRLMVATPTMREELERHGFRNISLWSKGRGHRDVPSARRRRAGHLRRAGPPDLALRRPDRGGEEHRGLRSSSPCREPRSSSATGRSASELAAKYPDARVHRRQVRRRAGRSLRLRRRVRLPLAHRHLRPGDPGSLGRRHAGRRLPGSGADRHHPGLGRRRAGDSVDQGLAEACLEALEIDRDQVRRAAMGYSWRACAEEFLRLLQPYPEPEKRRFWRRLRRVARLRRRGNQGLTPT